MQVARGVCQQLELQKGSWGSRGEGQACVAAEKEEASVPLCFLASGLLSSLVATAQSPPGLQVIVCVSFL